MEHNKRLLGRLENVAASLAESGHGLALLGLGSAGRETDRLDQWSDLDFFAVVEEGWKDAYITNTAWLESSATVAWKFRNTKDGWKILWEDGIFGEMAVFELAELRTIPFAPGRVVWSRDGIDRSHLVPVAQGGRLQRPESVQWAREELLSCLHVGLCRHARGERLSAWRFIQGYCLDRYLELVELTAEPQNFHRDQYSRDRRFEQIYPRQAQRLGDFLGGYGRTPAAALAFLDWLKESGEVNPAMEAEIRRLAAV